jgi:hypothetical protein
VVPLVAAGAHSVLKVHFLAVRNYLLAHSVEERVAGLALHTTREIRAPLTAVGNVSDTVPAGKHKTFLTALAHSIGVGKAVGIASGAHPVTEQPPRFTPLATSPTVLLAVGDEAHLLRLVVLEGGRAGKAGLPVIAAATHYFALAGLQSEVRLACTDAVVVVAATLVSGAAGAVEEVETVDALAAEGLAGDRPVGRAVGVLGPAGTRAEKVGALAGYAALAVVVGASVDGAESVAEGEGREAAGAALLTVVLAAEDLALSVDRQLEGRGALGAAAAILVTEAAEYDLDAGSVEEGEATRAALALVLRRLYAALGREPQSVPALHTGRVDHPHTTVEFALAFHDLPP